MTTCLKLVSGTQQFVHPILSLLAFLPPFNHDRSVPGNSLVFQNDSSNDLDFNCKRTFHVFHVIFRNRNYLLRCCNLIHDVWMISTHFLSYLLFYF